MLKECPGCKRVLPIDCYYVNRKSGVIQGLQSRCKRCHYERVARNRAERRQNEGGSRRERRRNVVRLPRAAYAYPPAQIAAIRRASSEGRLHPALAEELGLPTGKYACAVCGMLHFERSRAASCCHPLEPGISTATHIMAVGIRVAVNE